VSPATQSAESISFGARDIEKAFRNKQLISLKAFRAKYIPEQRADKPIVVVSLHCFSDFPHHAGNLLFLDYYSAFTETMEMIAENHEVNWFVKPHPSRRLYGEDDLVEEYLQAGGFANVKLWPAELSTLSALEWAGCFVTVNGTIGLEAACFGKPVLLGGSSNYGHLGFSMSPSTRAEYHAAILQAHKWAPLTKDQVSKARRALYRYHNLGTEKPADIKVKSEFSSDIRSSQIDLSCLVRGEVSKLWLS
jgi:capsule polysaccharide export protein KpsC/LpsZ